MSRLEHTFAVERMVYDLWHHQCDRIFAFTEYLETEPLPEFSFGFNFWRVVITACGYDILIEMRDNKPVTTHTGKLRVLTCVPPMIIPASNTTCVEFELLPRAEGCRVGDVLQTLKGLGLHFYRFTAEGRGNRYWVHHFVTCLQDVGLIATDSLDRISRASEYLWFDGKAYPGCEIVPGEWFAVGKRRASLVPEVLIPTWHGVQLPDEHHDSHHVLPHQ